LSLSVRVSNAEVMHLSHLGLPIRDLRRSQRFYSAYFGFDPATAQEYEDGTVIIRNADGFDLALHPVEHVELGHPGNLGGHETWEDARSWRHRRSIRMSCANAR
jgi:catechol 2,3-dioxygenase-like lactoylglutathione lyase family enzyme